MRGLRATVHRVRTEPLSAPCWGTAFARRLLPADSSSVGLLFRLPALLCRSPQPCLPGTQGPAPPRGRNLSGCLWGSTWGRASLSMIPPLGRGSVQGDLVVRRPLTHPRGLQLGSLCSYLQAALICWVWGLGSQLTPIGQLPLV